MKVLVGCEFSGAVRDAFIDAGHDAMSCDLLPTESPGPHYQGDIRDVLGYDWDLAIFHPDCTYLTVSAEWAYKPEPDRNLKSGTLFGIERQRARDLALAFVTELWNCGIPRVAIENPVGVINSRLPFMPTPQYIQPHWFGHDASKKTGLWKRGLPDLVPTEMIIPRVVNGRPRWANQTDSGQNNLSPSSDRWKLRAATYPGIAAAMANQWGSL